jgi:hypothetical protein
MSKRLQKQVSLLLLANQLLIEIKATRLLGGRGRRRVSRLPQEDKVPQKD